MNVSTTILIAILSKYYNYNILDDWTLYTLVNESS